MYMYISASSCKCSHGAASRTDRQPKWLSSSCHRPAEVGIYAYTEVGKMRICTYPNASCMFGRSDPTSLEMAPHIIFMWVLNRFRIGSSILHVRLYLIRIHRRGTLLGPTSQTKVYCCKKIGQETDCICRSYHLVVYCNQFSRIKANSIYDSRTSQLHRCFSRRR